MSSYYGSTLRRHLLDLSPRGEQACAHTINSSEGSHVQSNCLGGRGGLSARDLLRRRPGEETIAQVAALHVAAQIAVEP
jgi:hypothetical protein